jgi:hypothetical protein
MIVLPMVTSIVRNTEQKKEDVSLLLFELLSSFFSNAFFFFDSFVDGDEYCVLVLLQKWL